MGLLGPLTASTSDGQVELASPVQRRLLTLLALDAGRVLSADRLEELLECTPGALRTIVSRLRQRVGPDHIRTSPPGYSLVASTDAVEFGRLLDGAREATGDEALVLLDRALALWRGQAVEEFAAEAWAIPEVTRLEELRAAAVEQRAEGLLAAGRPEVAVADLRAHITRHPLRERPHGLLMQALAASGRSTEALRVYQDLRQLLVEVGTEPSEGLRAIERDLTEAMDVPAGRAPRPSLPAQRTSLLGRDELVERVRGLLGEHRLVTLIGPGGVGKTRLAIEAARRAAPGFPGGVWFADLTRAATGADVPGEVVRAMRATPRVDQSAEEAIADLVADRGALLVLDNCEHVIDRAAEIVDDLLVACPNACVVATSREPLELRGERRIVVPSLDVDGPASSGVRLFVERAAEISDARVASAEDLDAVVEVVRHLDGIPLAIELAAAQVADLDVGTIRDSLGDRFTLLVGRLRRVPPRQQTLAATIDWSYQRLRSDEQRALRLLAAGAGPVSQATATRLLGVPEAEAVDLLESLVKRSLLVEVTSDDHHLGWTLLESLRQFGRERAADVDDPAEAVTTLEQALLPLPHVLGDWSLLANTYLCAPGPEMLVEDSTRLAAADRALAEDRIDAAALLFASVAYRDDIGVLAARAAVVKGLVERSDELSDPAWLAACATELLLARGARDYGRTYEIATTMLATLPADHPSRSWFEVWRCALISAVDPRGGLAELEAALPDARRGATLPLDWALSQMLSLVGTAHALLGDLEEADRWAVEAAERAPHGQESRDQVIALRLWVGYLRGRPVTEQLLRDVDRQPHDLGLAELCAAPGALCTAGTITERATALVDAARGRPSLDIPTPFLLAFAWLAIEEGAHDRAAELLSPVEIFDATTQVALVHARAAVDGWTATTWDAGRDAVVAAYLAIDHEQAVERGVEVLDAEVRRWERILGGARPAGVAATA